MLSCRPFMLCCMRITLGSLSLYLASLIAPRVEQEVVFQYIKVYCLELYISNHSFSLHRLIRLSIWIFEIRVIYIVSMWPWVYCWSFRSFSCAYLLVSRCFN